MKPQGERDKDRKHILGRTQTRGLPSLGRTLRRQQLQRLEDTDPWQRALGWGEHSRGYWLAEVPTGLQRATEQAGSPQEKP